MILFELVAYRGLPEEMYVYMCGFLSAAWCDCPSIGVGLHTERRWKMAGIGLRGCSTQYHET